MKTFSFSKYIHSLYAFALLFWALPVYADSPVQGLQSFLGQFYSILSKITFAAAILSGIYGAVMYITSAGDMKKLAKAKSYIEGAVIGLIALTLAQAFFNILNVSY